MIKKEGKVLKIINFKKGKEEEGKKKKKRMMSERHQVRTYTTL